MFPLMEDDETPSSPFTLFESELEKDSLSCNEQLPPQEKEEATVQKQVQAWKPSNLCLIRFCTFYITQSRSSDKFVATASELFSNLSHLDFSLSSLPAMRAELMVEQLESGAYQVSLVSRPLIGTPNLDLDFCMRAHESEVEGKTRLRFSHGSQENAIVLGVFPTSLICYSYLYKLTVHSDQEIPLHSSSSSFSLHEIAMHVHQPKLLFSLCIQTPVYLGRDRDTPAKRQEYIKDKLSSPLSCFLRLKAVEVQIKTS